MGGRAGSGRSIIFQAKSIKEFGSWRVSVLEVPGFVKSCMMTCFRVSAVEVEIADILVGGGIPEEEASEVLLVKF